MWAQNNARFAHHRRLYTHADRKGLMYTNTEIQTCNIVDRLGGVCPLATWCRWMPSAADPESTLGHYNKERGSTKPREWRAWEENYSGIPLGKQPWHSHLSQLHRSYTNWHLCPRRLGRPPPHKPLLSWYCIKGERTECINQRRGCWNQYNRWQRIAF